MKLRVFEFIDEVVEELESNRNEIKDISEEISLYFERIFKDKEAFYGVSNRVKGKDSLSEKILRQNLFLKYKTSEEVIVNISDIIGVRVQCRFMKDEGDLYDFLLTYFSIESRDMEGYYYNPENDHILLKLSDKQPQTQQNGFPIYRIDGKYVGGKYPYNFELQIQSFVNVFWGDIEHDILYKNFTYMITEDFLREMLYSIKRNLEQVDAQLLVVYQYLSQLEFGEEEANAQQFKKMVSKLIHDIFSVGFKDSTGVLLDFRISSDLIVDYLFAQAHFDMDVDIVEYSTSITRKLTLIKPSDFKYGDFLAIEDLSFLVSDYSRKLGSGVASIMNVDLKWNLILSIIFELEDRNKEEVFGGFIDYLVYKISSRIDKVLKKHRVKEEDKEAIRNRLMDICMDFAYKCYDSDFFSDKNMDLIKQITYKLLEEARTDSKPISNEDLDYEAYIEKLKEEVEG